MSRRNRNRDTRRERNQRSSIEDPRTPLSDPDEWLYDALGASTSITGASINRKTALGYAAVWRAVNLISGDVATLPLFVYERTDAGRERATTHPAYYLLRHQPNEYMSIDVFIQTLQAHAMLQPGGYAAIERDGAGRPTALLPLDPQMTYPVRVNGVLWFVTTVQTEQIRLAAMNTFHIHGLGYDGLNGYSVLEYGKDTLAVGLAARDHGGRFFQNALEPSSVLEVPDKMSDKAFDNLRRSWHEMHSGLENKHKIAILEEGAKLHAFSLPAKDAQLLETRQHEVREIANLFGVPPHKLGDPTRTAYASLEQENQSYLDGTLNKWLVTWERECNAKLLSETEKRGDTHYVEFVRQALVRADLKTRAEYYTKALGGKPWLVADEVRGMENMNDLPDGEGKKYSVPLNIGPQPEPPPDEIPPNKGDDGASRAAANQVLRDTASRMMRRLDTQAKRAAARGETALATWLAGPMRADNAPVVTDAARTMAAAVRAAGGTPGALEAIVAAVFDGYTASLGDTMPGSARNLRGRWAATHEIHEAALDEIMEAAWGNPENEVANA